ncbi:cytochrome P450 [Zopfia rhizophila CBS 207.26]|uniref:Cytochrome P450 n=1 Tax=Zopfia rhizophila CBS 207.26 TaxID=1314779 RepID=A0A6A6DBK2_9PEZI|nr:cytochrome P450 [Zopfia rhizophila CBS 207.26]
MAACHELLFRLPFTTLVLITCFCAYRVLAHPLRHLSGPRLARISSLFRLRIVSSGYAPSRLASLHAQYGEVVVIGPNHVSVSSPEVLPIVYGPKPQYRKSAFYRVFDPVYRGRSLDTLFTTRDPVHHKQLRSSVAGRFSSSGIRHFEPAVTKAIDDFVTAMLPRLGRVIEVEHWLDCLTFDIATATTFGQPWGALKSPETSRAMFNGLRLGFRYGAIVGQIPGLHPWLLGSPVFLHTLNTLGISDPVSPLFTLIDEALDRYDQDAQNLENTVIGWLHKKGDHESLLKDRTDFVNQLFCFAVVGGNVSISLLTVLYCLVKHPRIYDRLKAEIKESGPRELRPLTYAEALNMPYLQAVLKEALRLYPPASLPFERITPISGLYIRGHFIPPRTVISTSPQLMHLNTEIYGLDANQFRPERWIDAQGDTERLQRMEKCFFAFGRGNRNCIGKSFAIMQMSIFLVTILAKFDVQWAGGEDEEWATSYSWVCEQTNIKLKFIHHST